MNRHYDVAAYLWPSYHHEPRVEHFWPEKDGEWYTVRRGTPRFPGHDMPRIPLLGWQDEAGPKVMRQHVELAMAHGINVFIMDWYWYENAPCFERQLNEGLIPALKGTDCKFYLMWANHDVCDLWNMHVDTHWDRVQWPGRVSRDVLEPMFDRIIDKYLKLDCYYRIAGKPVFSIYEYQTLMAGLGGLEATRDALDWMRRHCRERGLPGMDLQTTITGLDGVLPDGSLRPGSLAANGRALGFDSATSYQFVHTAGGSGDYVTWADKAIGLWPDSEKVFGTYHPHASIGWDNTHRNPSFKQESVVVNATPDAFEACLWKAKAWLDARPQQAPLVTINSWNEWTEGSYLLPDMRWGYRYLQAVRNVFTQAGSMPTCPADGSVLSWPMPAGMPANPAFEVQVRASGTAVWTDLFVHRVQVGMMGQTPHDSAMALFDFEGSVDVRVVYRAGDIRAFDIRPLSYEIRAEQDQNTLTFTVRQVPEAPRKIVIRINDDWYTGVLHLLTNPLDRDAPRLTDPQVYAVEPGEPVPIELPAGKTVYYFKPGLHELPRGLWLDIDLGGVHTIDQVQLDQGRSAVWRNHEIANRFKVEVAVTREAGFRLAYDGTENQEPGSVKRSFPVVPARYVRLWLLGSTHDDETALYASLREFRVFAAGGIENLALRRAVGGGLPNFAHATDGNPDTEYTTVRHYGNWHAGESFFVAKHGTTLYLAGGAVLRGSICADEVDDVTVRGRGILDCRHLTHRHQWCEGRAPAIWLVSGHRPVIEGVTVIDAVSWGVLINWSRHGVVRNINMINNKVNGDGIHVSGSTDALVEGVFVRSPDDLLVSYHFNAPSSGLVARHCVFWADMVQTLLLGMGGGGDIRDYLFHNIDVVNSRGFPEAPLFTGVIKLWANQNCTISNIEFRDIRIDPFQRPEDVCVFQIRNDSRERQDFKGPPVGTPGGEICNITLDGVVYRGSGEAPSLIIADKALIRGLLFQRCSRAGRCVERLEDAHVEVCGLVELPRFAPLQSVEHHQTRKRR